MGRGIQSMNHRANCGSMASNSVCKNPSLPFAQHTRNSHVMCARETQKVDVAHQVALLADLVLGTSMRCPKRNDQDSDKARLH
jgi:hypothetical protein